jgi:hypothetical protein
MHHQVRKDEVSGSTPLAFHTRAASAVANIMSFIGCAPLCACFAIRAEG